MIYFLLFIRFIFSAPPLSDPGEDQIVNFGATVTLDGSGSFDPDGTVITDYIWTTDDNVVLSGSNQAIATFNAPNSLDKR